MSGSPLSEFTTFAQSQGPAWASSAESLVNEAAKRVYTISRITAHKDPMEYCQGGDEIRDRIYFDVKSTFRRYNPNFQASTPNFQTGTDWTVPWAFAIASVTWTKQEVGLNKETHTAKFRAQKYKSVLHQKYQNLYTDICNSIESELWAAPDKTLMEDTTLPEGEARVPLSIPAFVNEFASGLHGGATGTGTWTTVQQISSSAQAKWQNQAQAYDADFDTAANAAKIFAPLSKLARKMKFDRLPKGEKYSSPTQKPQVIFASSQGLANYEFALQNNQDQFRGVGKLSGQDPDYDEPTFRGIPFEYIESLDDAAIYPTGASDALSTELDTANAAGSTTSIDGVSDIGKAGPRYYMMNFEHFNYVVHSDYFMDFGEPKMPTDMPTTYVQYVDMWCNLICRSRRRGAGFLFPSAAVTSA